MQLRSGTLEAAPKKKIASAYRIFFEERKLHHTGMMVSKLNTVISEEFEKLSEKQRKQYEDKYEKYNDEYKQILLAFYGATKTDIRKIQVAEKQIPEKPKRPLAPFRRYQQEVIEQFQKENPDAEYAIIQKMIANKYRGLSVKEKLIYELPYDTEYELYQKVKDEWNEKYGEKIQAHQKFVDEKHRRVKDQDDDEFVYQQLARTMKTMKIQDKVKTEKLEANVTNVMIPKAKVAASNDMNQPQKKQGRPKSKDQVTDKQK